MYEDVLKSAARPSATKSSHCVVTSPSKMIKWSPEIKAKKLPKAWHGQSSYLKFGDFGDLGISIVIVSSQNHKPSETDVTFAGRVPCDLPWLKPRPRLRWDRWEETLHSWVGWATCPNCWKKQVTVEILIFGFKALGFPETFHEINSLETYVHLRCSTAVMRCCGEISAARVMHFMFRSRRKQGRVGSVSA